MASQKILVFLRDIRRFIRFDHFVDRWAVANEAVLLPKPYWDYNSINNIAQISNQLR
jgi:hypothetical protein